MKKELLITCFCFIFSTSSFCQSFDWAYNIHGIYTNLAGDIAVDAGGNVYATGKFTGLIDFDPGPGTYYLNAPFNPPFISGNVYVSKTDSSGSFLWAKAFGQPDGDDFGYSICVDNSGNVLTSGIFGDTVDADPGPGVYNIIGNGGFDFFISKLDANGNFVWAKGIGGGSIEHGYSVATDIAGNIYVAGNFNDTVDFDPGPGAHIVTTGPSDQLFLLKLDSNGNFKWVYTITGYSIGYAVKCDPFGNIYLGGFFDTFADFDPGPGSTVLDPFTYNGFIAKLDSAGNFIWAKPTGWVTDMELDINSNLLLIGSFGDTADFDPGPAVYNLIGSGGNDIFILKLDSGGNFTWAHNFGSAMSDIGHGISSDNLGNVYANGIFQDTVDFDPGPGIFNLVSPSTSAFILKLTSSGNFISCGQVAPIHFSNKTAIAADSTGNIYVTGHFRDFTDFDPGQGFYYMSSGQSGDDAYILKLKHDSCSNLALVIGNAGDVICSQPGFASAYALNGVPPYQYVWNTLPPDNDSVISVSAHGIYTVTVTDNSGCSRNASVLINEPYVAGQFDLDVNLAATTFVPGLTSVLHPDGFNDGCLAVSGNLLLVIDPSVTYVSAVPPPGLIIGDSLIWWFSNLTFDSAHVMPQVIVTTDTSANAGDNLCFGVFILPVSGDADSSNNQKQYCYPVQNSFDPNYKDVFPAGACNAHYVSNDDYLTYTINFQNTGDTTANNIIILDSLDTSLDLATLRVISSSHGVITEILPGNILKFRFDNIFLPDSSANEPASHGYIIFKVLPVAGIIDGTIVDNRVMIIFDFNDAVITNSVMNTVVSLIPPDISVIQNGSTLTANATGVTYQWVNCGNNYSVIAGATGQSFTPVANGSYAVIINEPGCIDTSSCYMVNSIGVFENSLNDKLYIYPNPANKKITIELGNYFENINLEISNYTGEIIKKMSFSKTEKIEMELDVSPGLYFVHIYNLQNQRAIFKLIIE